MELLFASGNAHKREELSRILEGKHTLLLPQEIGLTFDYEETGETFTENALGKAMYLYQQGNSMPVIADDSGLVIPALGGAPGVRTARYGSEQAGRLLESHERNQYLLKNMQHLTGSERAGSFVCAIALVLSPNRIWIVQESVDGHIIDHEDGCGGFGYDPVFYIDEAGSTMAALSPEQKDYYSHRGRAARKLLTLIDTL